MPEVSQEKRSKGRQQSGVTDPDGVLMLPQMGGEEESQGWKLQGRRG